jgi:hypothetical protein
MFVSVKIGWCLFFCSSDLEGCGSDPSFHQGDRMFPARADRSRQTGKKKPRALHHGGCLCSSEPASRAWRSLALRLGVPLADSPECQVWIDPHSISISLQVVLFYVGLDRRQIGYSDFFIGLVKVCFDLIGQLSTERKYGVEVIGSEIFCCGQERIDSHVLSLVSIQFWLFGCVMYSRERTIGCRIY